MTRAWGEAADHPYGLPILVFCAAIAASPAAAQTATPTLSEVTAAPIPAGSTASQASVTSYEPKGMPLGGFRLFPTLETVGDYDDNVFLSQTNQQSDYFFRETPQFMLRSDWSRHMLDLYGAASLYQYTSLTNENHVDWDAGGDGRLDIYQGMSFAGSGSYSVEHLANSSPDQPTNAKSPSEFSIAHSSAALSYNPYHFGFYLGGTFDRYVYDSTELIDDLLESNADRNEDAYSAYAKASYEVSPGYAVFVQGTDNQTHYDLPVDRSGIRRDSEGYAGNAGVDMLVTNLIRGQVFVGYLDQRYKAPFTDVSGVNFGANVTWFTTPLWTFGLTASRSLNGTVLATASTEDDRTVQLSSDFRAAPDIVVTGSAGYLDAKFEGSPRDDRYITGRLSLSYYLNPWISAEVSDTYQVRNSTVSGQNFNDNVATIGLKFQE
jgi:hypothetical protein